MVITEVRIKLMDDSSENERLQAFCSVTFDDAYVVRDLKIIEGTEGSFVAMPSRKLTDRCPGCGSKNHLRARYCNSCHPGGARGAGPSLIELGPGLSDDLIRDSVRKGRNRMPAYNQSLISDDALTDMIAYIRTLK